MKKIKKILTNRLIYIGIAALFEIAFYLILFRLVKVYAGWIEVVLHILSVFIVLHIIRTSQHLSSDLMWLVIIMLAPVAGTAVFLLLGANM